MKPERAEEMLREYKGCVGRCGYLKKAILEAEADIATWERSLAADLANSGGVNMDGMPHGTAVGKPTERMALALAAGYEPGDLKEAKERLMNMIRELREKEMVVVFVEAWLSGLTEREKWLIEQLYFEQQTYAYIISSLRSKHGVNTSKDGVRRMKKAALEKIFEMAG